MVVVVVDGWVATGGRVVVVVDGRVVVVVGRVVVVVGRVVVVVGRLVVVVVDGVVVVGSDVEGTVWAAAGATVASRPRATPVAAVAASRRRRVEDRGALGEGIVLPGWGAGVVRRRPTRQDRT